MMPVTKRPAAIEALRKAEHRVNTVAVVHQALEHSRQQDRVDLLDLATRIATHLVAGSPIEEQVTLVVSGHSVPLDPDIAVPVALILNEWITATLAGVVGRNPVSITITLHCNESICTLDYQDQATGRRGDVWGSTGVSIVEVLTQQIGADCKMAGTSGWRLVFPHAGHADAPR